MLAQAVNEETHPYPLVTQPDWIRAQPALVFTVAGASVHTLGTQAADVVPVPLQGPVYPTY